MSKIRISNAELLDNAKSQIAIMKHYCELFDGGQEIYIPEIALKIRVLLHTASSKSLYDELLECYGMEKVRFPDSRGMNSPYNSSTLFRQVSSKMYEIDCKVEPDGCTFKIRFKALGKHVMVSFEDWWLNTPVMVWENQKLNRSEVVRLIANQLGGAHTDKEIDERIYNLKEMLVSQIRLTVNRNEYIVSTKDVLYSVLRTIANEVIYVFESKIFSQFR